jgi:hypothetical protein
LLAALLDISQEIQVQALVLDVRKDITLEMQLRFAIVVLLGSLWQRLLQLLAILVQLELFRVLRIKALALHVFLDSFQTRPLQRFALIAQLDCLVQLLVQADVALADLGRFKIQQVKVRALHASPDSLRIRMVQRLALVALLDCLAQQ